VGRLDAGRVTGDGHDSGRLDGTGEDRPACERCHLSHRGLERQAVALLTRGLQLRSRCDLVVRRRRRTVDGLRCRCGRARVAGVEVSDGLLRTVRVGRVGSVAVSCPGVRAEPTHDVEEAPAELGEHRLLHGDRGTQVGDLSRELGHCGVALLGGGTRDLQVTPHLGELDRQPLHVGDETLDEGSETDELEVVGIALGTQSRDVILELGVG